MTGDSPSFDPLGLLRALHDEGVEFVIIGGVAARAHGSPSVTADLDICYARTRDNLEALARVLRRFRATLRGADPDLPFQVDWKTLELGDHFTFSTDAGDLDCLGTPLGTGGYRDLVQGAARMEIGGVLVWVASLEDVIRMKQAVGRPKDRIELEVLGALRDEVERGES